MNLGKLEKVDLRGEWQNEERDFTPWLAEDENIERLSEAIGLELEVQSQEERVGPFRADILCRDTATDHYVLIENQLERTDHLHLGQLITYAAGLEAVTIIWIARQFTEEHRASIDWLNNITDERFRFFGIEIELYRIGDSPAAPMFKIIAKPNDWSKDIRKSAESGQYTETKLLQREYWQALKDFMEKNKSFIKMQKPLPQHWYNISIGRSAFRLSAFVNSFHNLMGVTFHLFGPAAKENFRRLKEQYHQDAVIHFGNEFEWMELPDGIESKIRITHNGSIEDRPNWGSQHQWFKEKIERMHSYFSPKIKDLPGK